MGFDYDKLKAKSEQGDSFWASYSDLFMMLSVVFLLLYVVSSLKNGTFGYQKNVEFQRITYENEDLKQQIKVYETLKDQHLNDVPQKEQQVYEELMAQLHLLKDEAKEEKEDLQKRAKENEAKERALNKYQQVIRNVINANVLSQARVKRRDHIIAEREEEITEKKQEIKGLKKSVQEKQKSIAQGEEEISKINKKLERKIREMKKLYTSKKITEEKMQREVSELKRVSNEKIQNLKKVKESIKSELEQISSQLDSASKQLESAKQLNEIKDKEKQKLVGELNFVRSNYEQQLDSLKSEFEEKRQREQEKLKNDLRKAKATQDEIAQREAELRDRLEKERKNLNRQLGALEKKIADTSAKLATVQNTKDELEKEASNMKLKTVELKKDLKVMKELAEARKNLARRISNNFKNAGVKADVDPDTGDVILSFGDEYFDTGKSDLKSGMVKILEKFIPSYSKSLFEDKKIADKISSVEIVGFASPTYQGRIIDPNSLDTDNRAAVNYNLDLSYYRARSIFSHIFDTKKMTYDYQKDLLSLVKVTGRSFLAEKIPGRDIAQASSQKEFCKVYDCKKAQRVIIRFELE